MPYLVAFSGLPGVGKSTIAQALCKKLSAVYLRVDEVEAALKRSRLAIHPAEDAGYLALAAIAASNLKLGHNVVADTVNPVQDSRDLWFTTARSSSARLINIEVMCSDIREHRERVESRTIDINALTTPNWRQVQERHYEPWIEARLRLDSTVLSVADAVSVILSKISEEDAGHKRC